jgi:hypothetical protein
VSLFSDSVAVTPMTTTMLTDGGRFGTVYAEAGNGQVRLRWNATTYGTEAQPPTAWRVSRWAGPGSAVWYDLQTVYGIGEAFDAGGLVNGTEYRYMVQPCCPDRLPSYVSATPYLPARGNARPVVMTSPDCARGVRVTWEPAVAGTYTPVSGYAVFRSDDGGATLGRAGTTAANVLTFLDCTVPVYGKRYLYLIRPIDANGNLGDAYPSALIDVVLPTIRTYPDRNRFRPGLGERVHIVFQTTEAGRVRVSIWSPGGEKVRSLLDEEITGSFSADTPYNSRDRLRPPLVWDGANDAGELVGSGAYLIAIEVNGNRDFRAVAVLR